MTYEENEELVTELIRLHVEEEVSGTECGERLGIAPATAIRLLRRNDAFVDRREKDE